MLFSRRTNNVKVQKVSAVSFGANLLVTLLARIASIIRVIDEDDCYRCRDVAWPVCLLGTNVSSAKPDEPIEIRHVFEMAYASGQTNRNTDTPIAVVCTTAGSEVD